MPCTRATPPATPLSVLIAWVRPTHLSTAQSSRTRCIKRVSQDDPPPPARAQPTRETNRMFGLNVFDMHVRRYSSYRRRLAARPWSNGCQPGGFAVIRHDSATSRPRVRLCRVLSEKRCARGGMPRVRSRLGRNSETRITRGPLHVEAPRPNCSWGRLRARNERGMSVASGNDAHTEAVPDKPDTSWCLLLATELFVHEGRLP